MNIILPFGILEKAENEMSISIDQGFISDIDPYPLIMVDAEDQHLDQILGSPAARGEQKTGLDDLEPKYLGISWKIT